MENKGGTLTLSESCNILKKSKRTVSRYIKAGKLHPEKIKGEYHFKKSEVEGLLPDTTGQMAGQVDLVSFLIKQLEEKDKQIAEMNSRQRELNILLGQAQKKIFLLEDQSKDNKPDKDAIHGFFGRLFKGE